MVRTQKGGMGQDTERGPGSGHIKKAWVRTEKRPGSGHRKRAWVRTQKEGLGQDTERRPGSEHRNEAWVRKQKGGLGQSQKLTLVKVPFTPISVYDVRSDNHKYELIDSYTDPCYP